MSLLFCQINGNNAGRALDSFQTVHILGLTQPLLQYIMLVYIHVKHFVLENLNSGRVCSEYVVNM